MKPWSEVEAAPEFAALSAAEQGAAREQYFTQVVAPRVPKEELGDARAQFDAATRIKKQDLPAGVPASTAGAGRGAVNPPAVEPTTPRKRGGMRGEGAGPYVAADTDSPTWAQLGEGTAKAVTSFDSTTAMPAGASVLDRGRVEDRPVPPVATSTPLETAAGMSIRPGAEAEAKQMLRARGQPVPGERQGEQYASAPSLAQNLATDVREFTKNPVARGAVAGFFDLAQVGTGAVRLAADLAGAKDVAQFAGGASRVGKAMSDGSMQGLQGNDKLIGQVTNSIIVSAPSMAMGVMGGPALRTLFAQSALAEYNEGRNAGFDPGESAVRAGIMGTAEALGERFGFPEQIKLLKGVVKGMPSNEMAKTLGEMIKREIPGEQLTTAMQFLADKVGPAALHTNATLSDYLEAAGETLKVTIGQTAVMGGGPAAIATGRDVARGADAAVERSALSLPERAAKDAGFKVDPEQALAQAIEASPYGRAKAKGIHLDPPLVTDPPEAQRTKVEGVFRNAAAAFGMSKKAVDGAMAAADGKPLAELPGFFARFTQAIAKRGMVGSEVDPDVLEAMAHGAIDPGARPALDAGAVLAGEQPTDDFTGLADPSAAAAAPVQAPENVGRVLSLDPEQEPAPIAGEQINRKWTAFSAESGTLDIPREQMPQIKAEHRGALVNFLNARGVTHEQQEVPAASLKPTQREFSTRKVQDAADYEGGDRSILVSADGYVLDGHHQWLAKLDAGAPVSVIRLNAPITDLLRLAHQFPSSTTANGPKPRGVTNEPVADLAGTAGMVAGSGDGRSPDAGGSQRDLGQLPADAGQQLAPAAAAPVRGSEPVAPVGTGRGPGDALKAGDTLELDGKAYRVVAATKGGASIADEQGNKRMVRAGSPAWRRITQAQAGSTPTAGSGTTRPTQQREGAQEPAPQPQQGGGPGTLGTTPAPTPKARKAPRGGSGPLDAISRAGGISQSLIADLSRKTQRTRTSKTGKATTFTAWHNPMAGGKGPVFRASGTADLNELARILEEAGFLEPGLVERDYLEANSRVQDILKAALNGEKVLKEGDADAIEREMRARQEAAMDDAPDPFDFLSDDDLQDAGYTGSSRAAQDLIERMLADAEAAGIDTETLRDDVARQSEGLTDDEYQTALQQALDQVLTEHGQGAAARDTSPASGSDQGDGQTTGPPGREGSDRADRPDEALRADRPDGLTLESQTAADLAAKTEREARADEIDQRQQIDAERDLFGLQQQAAPEQRTDTTSDMFGGPSAADVQAAPGTKPATSPNTIFTDDAAAKARDILRKKLGQLNSGLDPEMMQAGITLAGYHIERGARTFAAYARAMLADLGEAVRPYLKSWYLAAKYDPRLAGTEGMSQAAEVEAADVNQIPEADNAAQEPDDVRNPDANLERDRSDAAPADAAVDTAVPAEGRGTDAGDRTAGVETGDRRGRPANDPGVPAGGAVASGERSDQRVPGDQRPAGPSEFDAGTGVGQRGLDLGQPGVPAEGVAADQVARAADAGLKDSKKREAQRAADAIAVKRGDLDNIRATLPYLLPEQQEDVHKAEQRLSKPDGYGMLFTNGTGTGKTFTGLGVAKRFARQGKTNQLFVVPDAKIMADWVDSAKALGLTITPLEDTKDAGTGMVITTYANLGANNELARRDWDLVIPDEAHSLMQGKDGEPTAALDNLRAITMHPRGEFTRYAMLNAEDLAKQKDLSERITSNSKIINADDTMDVMADSLRKENERLEKDLAALTAKLKAAREAVRADVAAKQGEARTRATFLSATPFAYESTIDWAEGYLFNYSDGYPYDVTATRYNQPNPHDYFFMTRFGYRMRYNKLTKPDAKVNSGLLQRQFNGELKKAGSLAGRTLEVAADYDRKFVLVDSAVGNQIDQALDWLSLQSSVERQTDMHKPNAQRPQGMQLLSASINDQLYSEQGHLVRRYLLEAIKAKEVIPIIRQHLALGRKVVVFHDFNKGGSNNPFAVETPPAIAPLPPGASPTDRENHATAVRRRDSYAAAVAAFRKQFPALTDGQALRGLISPIQRFTQEFPNVLRINGLEKPRDVLARYKQFNDDATGPIVALVQSEKNKGWSGHDTTGKHQRVLINLGLPTQPTKTIQQEGRIYRVGQVSDAMFRYLNTGTNWEKWAFAQTIARRASEAENLGAGEHARALLDAFVTGFEESDTYTPGHDGEGKGGKERDRQMATILTEYDRAKGFYWGTQKKNARTKAEEGTDYFATPEPVGLKMVQWLDLRGGEDGLEPSAGHGAIARWLPDNTNRTAIEPSMPLRARLSLSFDGKIIDGRFEDLHINNKFDGIAMNPPFGTAGRTAIDHLAKAATHLRDGGRIAALIPTGPSADAKFDKWFDEAQTRPAKPLYTDEKLGPIFEGDTLVAGKSLNGLKLTVGHVDKASDGRRTARPKGEPVKSGVWLGWIDSVKPGPRTEIYRPADGLHLVAEIKLPGVTFERAATNVMTRVVVIEKQADATKAPAAPKHLDLTNAKDVHELFDRLENIDMPPRAKAAEAEPAPAAAPAPAAPAGTMDRAGLLVVEHTTGKGKTIRGVVRTDLSQAQAKEIDAYTFKKDGGWFIREKYLKPDEPLLSRAGQTNTPEFKRWFGDSKVVGADGKPLVVYHGTRDDIAAFDGGRIKGRFPNSEGFYFTSNPSHASVYADSINNAAEGFNPASRFAKPAAEGGNVMPAYVSLQKPKIITVSEWGTLESAVDGDGGASVRAARAAGHDGVIVKRRAGDEYDGDLVIAFRPEQIKSATGNRGTFDSTSDRIDMRRGEGGGMDPAAVRQMIDLLKADGTITADLKVASTPDEMPLARRNALYAKAPDGAARGVYFRSSDEIWVFASNLRSLPEAVRVILHEGFHRGLHVTHGEAGAKLLRQIYATNKRVRDLADQNMADFKIGKEEATNEALADIAGLGEIQNIRGWAKLARMIREWVRKVADALGIQLDYTDADIAALVASMTRAGLKGGVSVNTAPAEMAMASRGKMGAMPEDANAPGQNADGSGADSNLTARKLTPALLQAGRQFVVDVERLAEQHGKVYVRWSPTSQRDLAGEQRSRDFVAGQQHEGLSAVEVTGQTHPVDIASAIAEYGFLRLQDRRSVPRVYLADRVGTDSDSHALIKPKGLLLEASPDVIKAVDAHFDDAMHLEDEIVKLKSRVQRSTGAGRDINEKALHKAETELQNLLNEQSAPNSGGAPDGRDALRWESTNSNAAGPEFYGNGIGLIAFQQIDAGADLIVDGLPADAAKQAADGLTMHDFLIVDRDGGVLGHAVMEVAGGQVVSVYRIEIDEKGKGTGRDVVRAILANTPGPVRIVHILPEAAKFWNRLGATEKDIHGNAITSWEASQAADAGRAHDGLQGAQQGLAADARAGREAQDAEAEGGPLLSRHTTEERAALARAGIAPRRRMKDHIRGAWDAMLGLIADRAELAEGLRQGSLDQFYGFLRAERRDIGNLPHEQSFYVTARLANGGTSGVMRGLLLHGQARWNANGQHLEKVPGTEGLLDILKPLGDDLNDWFGWMIGNRAARLKSEGRENNFTDPDIAALQGLANTPAKLVAFRAAALKYAAFKRSVLDLGQGGGIINPETRPAWDSADYIPFYREIDAKGAFGATGRKGLAGQSSGIRTLRGGEAALNDPIENLLMNFSRIVDASLKNNAIDRAVTMLEHAGSFAVEKVGYKMEPAIVPRAQIEKQLRDAGTPPQILAVLPPEAFDGMAKLWAIQAPSDPDVIRIMREGKPVFYKVHDPLLLKAATSFVPFDFPGLGVMRMFKRVLTATVTATPEFMARNFIRDSAAVQGIARTGVNPAKSVAGIVRAFKEDGAAEHMLFAGASFQSGNMNAADPTGTATAVRRALRQKGLDATSADRFIATIVDKPLRLWELYRKVGESVENANREAIFEATLKDTGSITAAAYQAKDLMDFSLRGSHPLYQLAADVLPFFNARVQGLYRLGRSDPKRVAIYAGVMATLSVALVMLNSGQDWYDELPDWDKDTYWHFKIRGQHFRIPKPFELGVAFATIPERIARYLAGKEISAEIARKLGIDPARIANYMANPESGAKLASRLWANVRDQLAFDPIPQALRPAANVWANKDTFRDAPIENQSDEGKLPHLRYGVRTSPTAKTILAATAKATDKIELSPKRLEYLVGGYLGTAGLYALGLSDMAVRALEGYPPQPAPRVDDLPVVRAFVRADPARSTVFESDLYKIRRDVDEVYRSVKALEKEGKPDEANKLALAHPKEMAAHGAVDRAARDLASIRKARDAIYRDRTMTPAMKRAELDKLQVQENAIAKQAIREPVVKALQ